VERRPSHARRRTAGSDPATGPRRPAGRLIGHLWHPDRGLRTVASLDEIASGLADRQTCVWVDVEDASPDLLEGLAGCLDLHPLVIEDIVERNQRAKIEYTGDIVHLVMFALRYDGELHPIEVDIVLGPDFLLTSHPADWRPLEQPNVARLGVERFLSVGPDLVLYAVVDPIVDGYFPVVDQLSDALDDLEDEVIASPSRAALLRLFQIRRALLEVRHAVTPERDVFNQLTNRENPNIHPDRILYFRDVYDHLIRITDELDTHRELVSGALDAYLSQVNNNLSDVMKRLTAVTAILAGVGAIAGIFGMSEAATAFDFREGAGFWLVTAFVVMVGALVFAYFRRIDWI
jgi:magnesium transporter